MPYTAPTTQSQSHACGTLIDVQGGQKPVEALQVGDMVRTKDNGYQPVRWIAARTLCKPDFSADPDLRPIRIAAGALGEARPTRDLLVSQQQCVLLDDWRSQMLFGEDEVLAPARALLNDQGITLDHDSADVTYHHILFDQHEIIYSNGLETESFHPASGGIDAVGAAKCAELFRLFPALECDTDSYGHQARATLSGHEIDVLMSC